MQKAATSENLMRYPWPMSVSDLVRRWNDRIDRERVAWFARHFWHRFLDDRCFESAGALAYTTMFALVPFSAVVLAVLSAFPVFDHWTSRLVDFVFSNFVPSSARAIEQYLRDSAESARQLPASGITALLVSLLLTMWSVEQAFNRIWRVHSPRPRLTRFLIYWTALTLGSLVMVSALATTSALFSLPALAGVEVRDFSGRLLLALPTVLELVGFTLAYWLIPHRKVPRRYALAGGVLATLMFEGLKWGFAIYLRNASFEQLYGALAVVPIFLIWIYSSWLAVLLGASFAASLSSLRFSRHNHPWDSARS
jgi:membrane protein